MKNRSPRSRRRRKQALSPPSCAGVTAFPTRPFYNCRNKFGGFEVLELRRLRQFEDKNRRLKAIFARQARDISALKDVLAKDGYGRGEETDGGDYNCDPRSVGASRMRAG